MKKFRSRIGIERTQQFLDKLGRAAWEPYLKNEDGCEENEHFGTPFIDRDGTPHTKMWEVLARSIDMFRGALMRGATKVPLGGGGDTPPNGLDIGEPSGWSQFEQSKLIDVITSDGIRSVPDAILKSMAYQETIKDAHGLKLPYYLYRGQSEIKYTVIPRLGRVLADDIAAGAAPPSNVTKVTKKELEDLAEFRAAWPVPNAEELDIYSFDNIAEDDSTWWMLMQHYADAYGNGSRLLDVTTSPLFALLFACVEWETGGIDDSKDGVVYLFIEGENAIVHNYLTEDIPTCDEAFDAKHDVRHMVVNPPHNERSKAQGGAFLWWREFWKPLTASLPYLRVPGQFKASIAKELLALGVGPKEAVRGEKGLTNDVALRNFLEDM